MRDRALGSTIRMQFVSTNPDGGGAPVAPSSAFAASDIRIYKDGSASEKTTTNGITVTSPFDSITGLHLVEIDTSNSTGDVGFWASGSVYHVRLVTAKTVATYSVSGLLIGEFSLELQTADVRKFGGTAGTFTSGKPDVQAAASVSGAVGSVTGAVGSVTGNVGGNVNGNVVGSVASVTGNVGGNVSGNVSGSVGSVTGAVGSVTGSVGSVVGNVGGSVASVAGAVGSVTGNVGGDVSGKVLGGGVGTISGDGVRAASVTGAVGSVTGSVGSVVGAVALDSSARVKLHGTQDDYAPLKASDYTAPLSAANTRTALGMAAADLDTQLDAILAAASAGAGTGARTVTITVNDGTTVLQNAVVRFTEGSNTYRAITNASGVATFNLDDATYTVAVSKVGYYYAGTTMIVNGTETATYSMTAVNVTPGTGDLTTGYLTCLDEEGAAEQGVSVRCQVVQVPASGTGFAYDSAVQLATSDADGLVEFPMVKGARYLVWRGSIKPPQGITPILISASAGSTTALGSLIGD